MPTARPKSESLGLRVLVDPPGPATWNMAVDEAMLLLGRGPALRLYGWSPHAVSLGYFQQRRDFDDVPRQTPIVRRLTGGGAIHHGDEVTFALTLDAAMLPADVAASYRLVHDALIPALADVGIRCERLAQGEPQQARPSERWCFQVPGCDDIVTPRGKLLGSAQRRIASPRPRVLHHGSLVLRRPSLTPFVAATEDAVPLAADTVSKLHDAVARHLAAAFDTHIAPSELTDAERELAQRLQNERYGNPEFTDRR